MIEMENDLIEMEDVNTLSQQCPNSVTNVTTRSLKCQLVSALLRKYENLPRITTSHNNITTVSQPDFSVVWHLKWY